MGTELRPLGIGEMLDRAVTLSVRYFVPLFLIWVLFAVPFSVLDFYGSADQAKVLDDLLKSVAQGGAGRSAALFPRPVFNGFTIALWSYFVLAVPLASGAIMTATNEAYLTGRASALAVSYREGARSWPALFGILVCWLALAALSVIGLFLALIAFSFFLSLTAYALSAFFGAVTIVGISSLLLVGIVGAMLSGLVVQIAYYTQIVERPGFLRSTSRGIQRVFGASTRRSIVLSLAVIAVGIAFLILGGGLQVLTLEMTHMRAVSASVGTLFGIASVVFTNALTLIYYYDIRVRTEGLDLQLALAPAQATAT